MKPSTSAAASKSQRLGSRRRASIETGGRIFMSGGPRGRVWLGRLFENRIGGFAVRGNHFELQEQVFAGRQRQARQGPPCAAAKRTLRVAESHSRCCLHC